MPHSLGQRDISDEESKTKTEKRPLYMFCITGVLRPMLLEKKSFLGLSYGAALIMKSLVIKGLWLQKFGNADEGSATEGPTKGVVGGQRWVLWGARRQVLWGARQRVMWGPGDGCCGGPRISLYLSALFYQFLTLPREMSTMRLRRVLRQKAQLQLIK